MPFTPPETALNSGRLTHFARRRDSCYLPAMKFSLADADGGYTIHAYTDEHIVIGERRYDRSLILQPERIIDDWPVSSVEQLQAEDFRRLAQLEPNLVLLGCGIRQHFPAPRLYRSLTDAGIGIEIMTTAAACRTYNILVSEGRAVVAALIL